MSFHDIADDAETRLILQIVTWTGLYLNKKNKKVNELTKD